MQSLAGVSRCIVQGADLPPYDLHAPLMSLPLAFATTAASIPAHVPYLFAPSAQVGAWRERLGTGARLRVGLAWSGNPRHGNDARRSMALAQLEQLVTDGTDAGVEWISVQRDVGASDGPALQRLPLRHFGPQLEDLGATAALLANLDLVISVDTSVAHLAGALGRPVWILLPWAPDWRWQLERSDSPWYPSARLFRQTATRDWAPVLQAVRHALLEAIDRHETGHPA
jgi:hypothetical protein